MYTGKKVTVVGLGRFGGGIGAVRWLCKMGADVTVSDLASAKDLTQSIAQISDCIITLHLGGHDEKDFTEADLLVVSPAVPDDIRPLVKARSLGIEITTEINLFLSHCRSNNIVGITGTVGKSTTTAMIGEILSQSRTVHVGGNIGTSLLGKLDEIEPDHVVVLELSSFQLDQLPKIAKSPNIALVTNLAPNHLDRHKTLANYANAKKNIFKFQQRSDTLILNFACELSAPWGVDAPGKTQWFDPDQDKPLNISLPGPHNQANALAALAVAKCFGFDRLAVESALQNFQSQPHRLQFVTNLAGATAKAQSRGPS